MKSQKKQQKHSQSSPSKKKKTRARNRSSEKRTGPRPSRSLKRPPALELGDTVALVCPAGRYEQEKMEAIAQQIRDFGFCVVTFPLKTRPFHYFSATDEERAAEFEWALREPGVKAIFACRAGYGSQRMLQHLKWQELKALPPKLVFGYSDLTILHQWIQNKLNWLSIHSPLVGFLDEKSLNHFLSSCLELPSAKKTDEEWKEVTNIGKEVSAKGKLVGGTLSVLQLNGPAALPEEPVILCLEDVNEEHYRLDRLIWNLIDANYGRYVKGIILGHLHKCGERDQAEFPIKLVHESLRKLCDGPIWTKARFGHGLEKQRLIPLGCQAQMKDQTLSLLEPVVS